jgi:hypothetical protein
MDLPTTEALMRTNRFGHRFAPARSSAHGTLLMSTEEDSRKLRHARHGLPPGILKRFGGPERFAPTVNVSLGRLATFAKNSGHRLELLLGKA